eukprot:4412248-Pyramimonas_sp.AAC.1
MKICFHVVDEAMRGQSMLLPERRSSIRGAPSAAQSAAAVLLHCGHKLFRIDRSCVGLLAHKQYERPRCEPVYRSTIGERV